MIALNEAFRKRDFRMDKTYTLPSLGILSLLPSDRDSLVDEVVKQMTGYGLKRLRCLVNRQTGVAPVLVCSGSHSTCGESAERCAYDSNLNQYHEYYHRLAGRHGRNCRSIGCCRFFIIIELISDPVTFSIR
ncbi:hypothetical protein Q0F98_21800 [Paenibacillus amylolyticus]|nr:hypothetical protein Q0F98_21800 [Paenibacillus amylolyticus]